MGSMRSGHFSCPPFLFISAFFLNTVNFLFFSLVFCMCSRHPEVLWAQRSDKVYLTIALPDARDISVKCEAEGLFSFSAVGVQGESFDFSLELFGNVVPEVSALLFISSLHFHSFGIEL